MEVLHLTEVEKLKLENIQLKKEKILVQYDKLGFLEKQLASEVGSRLDINIEDYSVNLENGELTKRIQE